MDDSIDSILRDFADGIAAEEAWVDAKASLERLMKLRVIEEMEALPVRGRILGDGLRMDYIGLDAVHERIATLKSELQEIDS